MDAGFCGEGGMNIFNVGDVIEFRDSEAKARFIDKSAFNGGLVRECFGDVSMLSGAVVSDVGDDGSYIIEFIDIDSLSSIEANDPYDLVQLITSNEVDLFKLVEPPAIDKGKI
jgi:hypothetical protein